MEKRLQEININQLREKVGSKKELYDFLTQECGAYLPKKYNKWKKGGNIWQIMTLYCFKRTDVIVAAVPQIEGLTSDDFLEYAQTKPSLLNYQPDQRDWLNLDKKWIVDILLSLDQEGINSMVQQAKIMRRYRLDQSNNLIVHMKPGFVSALNNSINYSVQKGRSAYLLKQSAKRRQRPNVNEEMKDNNQQPRQSKQKYLENNERMRQEFQGMRDQIDDLMNYKQLVHQLQNDGFLDDQGCPQIMGPIQQNNNC